MCTTCGCSAEVHDHDHDDDHDHDHDHDHGAHAHGKTLTLEANVLAKSQRLADQNRGWLQRHGVAMVNVMSSPGAGKTTLLEALVRKTSRPVMVIEGDQATSFDAERIRAAGARAVQVNTGTGCHLDPHMVAHALEALAPPRGALVIVENVGNLVCPALFDLGESERVVLLSTPEGDDKPKKYPHMFASASVVVVTKSDLLPYVPFDLAKCRAVFAEVCPRAEVLTLSSTTGEGVEALLWRLERGVDAGTSIGCLPSDCETIRTASELVRD